MTITTITTKFLNDIISGHGYGVAPAAVEAITRELLAAREAVPSGKFAGWGLYHSGRDEFGSWLKPRQEAIDSEAISKHGYVNVKLFTAPPAPAVPEAFKALIEHLSNAHAFIENTEAFGAAAAAGIIQCGGAEWNIDESKAALRACRAAMLENEKQHE